MSAICKLDMQLVELEFAKREYYVTPYQSQEMLKPDRILEIRLRHPNESLSHQLYRRHSHFR